MTHEYDFNYSYTHYEDGVFGKCLEMPAITAQAKTQDEVCSLLREMTDDYLEISKYIKNKK
ncbi:MAG TPA: hypothetical protein VN704_08270 [Verrucomicrobiae bacterium]|nr:hypothetical protein [Verrucomicrobiae bacterium]